MTVSSNIGCVIVTFNRLDYLKTALAAYENSVRKPAYVLVINNHSSDGAETFLENWKQQPSEYQRRVMHLPENIGGAGGFHTGLEEAMKLPAEWIWLADDDAYPDEKAIFYLDERIKKGTDGIAAICTAVWEQGQLSIDHRRRLWRSGLHLHDVSVPKPAYEKDEFPLDIFSYVGAAISKSVLAQVGLTRSDYFIHYDDTEHSIRIGSRGQILCIPAARVDHCSTLTQTDKVDWRFYYDVRNYYDLEKTHFPVVFAYRIIVDSLDILMHFLMGRKRKKYRVIFEGLKDACLGRMGVHHVYRPGWKPDFER